jgi:hypothetical protein
MQALVTTMLCKELNLDLEETFTPKQAARRAALHAAVSDIAPSAHKGTTPNPRKLSPLLQAAAASGILDEDDESLPRAKPSAKPVDFSDPETRAKLARIEEDWGDD